MDSLVLEGTKDTLEVNFVPEQGLLSFSGRSLPENNIEFFNPIFKYLKKFIENNKTKLTFNCRINYLNSGSSKRMMEIFKILDEYNKVAKVTVNWHYDKDDEDQLEEGEDFAEDFSMEFNLIPY